MRSTCSRAGARRRSGEASATGGQLVDIQTEITALENLEIQELRAEWRKLYRAEPPRRLSRDLILRAIAYRIQERTHGGLGLATERRLNALAEELKTKGASHFDAAAVLKPGTKLVREWHGRPYRDGRRGRVRVRRATLSLADQGRHADHRRALVGAGLLRPEETPARCVGAGP